MISFMEQRIALIGATGWIGRSVLERMEGRHAVVAVSGSSLGGAGIRNGLRLTGAQVVVNAAGLRQATWDELSDANIALVEGSLDYCREAGATFVTLGSAAEYGRSDCGVLAETQSCAPASEYGKSKRAATELVVAAHRDGVRAVVLRLFNVYGRCQPTGVAVGDLALRVRLAAEQDQEVVLNDWDVLRDYVERCDVARVVEACALGEMSLPPVVNIGTGQGLRLFDVVSEMAKLRGVSVLKGECSADRIPSAVADVGLLKRVTELPQPATAEGIAARCVTD
jgi:nucleoside-diphosphate-sugar epimerase